MLRFASPWFLMLLALIPLILYLRSRKPAYPAMGLPTAVVDGDGGTSPAMRFHWVLPAIKYTVLCLMIVALARPQHGTRKTTVLTEGINIVLAVDISQSMAALDFKRDGKIVNRLEAVKGVVREFISKRDGDRIGMVVFGSNAYTQLPLTRDYNTIVSILDRVEIGAAGPSTAIGDAIGISLKRLADIESKSNIIVLLTDGSSNAGELTPEVATGIAVQKKVKIYTVGVGTRGEAPFLVKHPLLGDRYVYQQVDIDEEALDTIAEKTAGLYFRAEDTEGLARVYNTIDELEKTEVKVQQFAEYKELYLFLILPAFALIFLWAVLINTRFLRIP